MVVSAGAIPITVEGPVETPYETQLFECTGTLHQLSNSMRKKASELAATGVFGTVYDNINMNFKTAEQVIGRHGKTPISNLSILKVPN